MVWYTSLIVNQAVRPLIEAFNKKYPGIAVKYVARRQRPDRHQDHERGAAGRPQSDVFDGIDSTPPLLQAGLVEPFVPSEADKYPAELKDPERPLERAGALFPHARDQYAAGAEERYPKTPQDLLDPKWKGKIAWSIVPASGSGVYVGSVLQTMGEEKGMTFLSALAKQDIINRRRHQSRDPRSGDLSASIRSRSASSIITRVLSAQKGAPVEWLVEPISAPMHSVGLTGKRRIRTPASC